MIKSTVSGATAADFPAKKTPPGLHRFAVLAAIMTCILIFVGGLVTSTGSGLAVPDWPLAFGRLVPPWFGGIRFEYSHRVVAAIVTILTLVLALWAWIAEPRRWVRNAALAAFGLVVVQALLGAMNVLLLLPLGVTVAHAATAQAFFCLMVGIAMFTNPDWEIMGRETMSGDDINLRTPRLAMLTVITTAAIYFQILIGALMRNMGAGLAIPDFPLSYGRLVPPGWSRGIAVNFAHRCGALAVAILIVWTALTILRFHRQQPLLLRPALGLLILLALQITLGALTIWTRRAVIPTTAHVVTGAGVLATSFALMLRVFRLAGAARGSRQRTAFAGYNRDAMRGVGS